MAEKPPRRVTGEVAGGVPGVAYGLKDDPLLDPAVVEELEQGEVPGPRGAPTERSTRRWRA